MPRYDFSAWVKKLRSGLSSTEKLDPFDVSKVLDSWLSDQSVTRHEILWLAAENLISRVDLERRAEVRKKEERHVTVKPPAHKPSTIPGWMKPHPKIGDESPKCGVVGNWNERKKMATHIKKDDCSVCRQALHDYEVEMMELEGQATRRMAAEINKAMEDFAKAVRADWTEQILSASFSLPDGTRVLWGDATIEQHKARRDFLLSQASGTLETAGRHDAAIKDLTSFRVTCLNDLAPQDDPD